jgi:hypothetical protein
MQRTPLADDNQTFLLKDLTVPVLPLLINSERPTQLAALRSTEWTIG